MKSCFKCEETKPLTEFYKHPQMGDGHLNKCKACAKKDVGIHRRKNLKRIREYDNRRAKLPHRIALSKKNTQRARKKSKLYAKCHDAISRAIRSGKLKRMPCQMCGTKDWVAAHHDDYTKALDVMWLCPQHHKARHAFLDYSAAPSRSRQSGDSGK